jgi:hypothetical protein
LWKAAAGALLSAVRSDGADLSLDGCPNSGAWALAKRFYQMYWSSSTPTTHPASRQAITFFQEDADALTALLRRRVTASTCTHGEYRLLEFRGRTPVPRAVHLETLPFSPWEYYTGRIERAQKLGITYTRAVGIRRITNCPWPFFRKRRLLSFDGEKLRDIYRLARNSSATTPA